VGLLFYVPLTLERVGGPAPEAAIVTGSGFVRDPFFLHVFAENRAGFCRPGCCGVILPAMEKQFTSIFNAEPHWRLFV